MADLRIPVDEDMYRQLCEKEKLDPTLRATIHVVGDSGTLIAFVPPAPPAPAIRLPESGLRYVLDGLFAAVTTASFVLRSASAGRDAREEATVLLNTFHEAAQAAMRHHLGRLMRDNLHLPHATIREALLAFLKGEAATRAAVLPPRVLRDWLIVLDETINPPIVVDQGGICIDFMLRFATADLAARFRWEYKP